ncbi:AraC family transcriptional regulator [Tomitella fengzijianii]|uniref:AraC family transcriptional regulator n=1 Tax=Tomitella fengzijianii TaxID=2597660 RepID=A0A516X1F8_9ACTN|nr:helix-turn-helix domain-containing protein [Tomitella fengzijianii]QDQ96915.1 AraC family transcriptional regulator [Tomitella fengzijianii]
MSTREFVHRDSQVPGVLALYGYAADGLEAGLHRGIPSRGLTFILSMDDPVEGADTLPHWNAGRLTAFDTLVAGLHIAPAYIRQPVRQRGIQVSVHPLAAPALFGVPTGELDQRTWQAEEILGPGVARLREQLHEIPGWDGRFDAVEGYLRARLSDARSRFRPRDEVRTAWVRLAVADGAIPVSALARDTCLSERQLAVVVRRELGVTPRDLGRLMRFDAAFATLTRAVRDGRRPLLADVATAAGFYDQAHLAREFRRFTDTSPSAFVDEEIGNIQAGGHRRAGD